MSQDEIRDAGKILANSGVCNSKEDSKGIAEFVKKGWTKADGAVDVGSIRLIQQEVLNIISKHQHIKSQINMQALIQDPEKLIKDPNALAALKSELEHVKQVAGDVLSKEESGILSMAAKFAGWAYDKLFGNKECIPPIIHAKLEKNHGNKPHSVNKEALGNLLVDGDLPMASTNTELKQPELTIG